MRWSSNDEIMQNTNTQKCAFAKKQTNKKTKPKNNENNLEVAFITNDQTFRLINKRG